MSTHTCDIMPLPWWAMVPCMACEAVQRRALHESTCDIAKAAPFHREWQEGDELWCSCSAKAPQL